MATHVQATGPALSVENPPQFDHDALYAPEQPVIELPPTFHHHHYSVDRKHKSSASQHSESGFGMPPQEAEALNRLNPSVPAPMHAQSTVTTTKKITTLITTTTTATTGNAMTGYQPWFNTVTGTQTQEEIWTTRDADLILPGTPEEHDASMDVDVQPPQEYAPHHHLGQAPPVQTGALPLPSAASLSGFSPRMASSIHPPLSPTSPHRLSNRLTRCISAPATPQPQAVSAAAHGPEAATITVEIGKLEAGAKPWTPELLVRLPTSPRASDVLILRLISDAPSSPNTDSEVFLAAHAPKFCTNVRGGVLIPAAPLPSAVADLGFVLDSCRISITLISGERIAASMVTDYLGGGSVSGATPRSKRRKLV